MRFLKILFDGGIKTSRNKTLTRKAYVIYISIGRYQLILKMKMKPIFNSLLRIYIGTNIFHHAKVLITFFLMLYQLNIQLRSFNLIVIEISLA